VLSARAGHNRSPKLPYADHDSAFRLTPAQNGALRAEVGRVARAAGPEGPTRSQVEALAVDLSGIAPDAPIDLRVLSETVVAS